MDSAASSVLTKDSIVLMSGFRAPLRMAMPVIERASSTRVAGRIFPVAAMSSNPPPLKISKSDVSPLSSRTGMDCGPPPMEEPYSVITLMPVACSNIGPRMLKAAVKPPEVTTLTCGSRIRRQAAVGSWTSPRRCLRCLLLVMGRIPLQMRYLRHILGQERRLGHKSLPECERNLVGN